MQPTQELIDSIYREKVLRARETPPEIKFFAGPQLFRYACEITKSGIRQQHPDFDEAAVLRELERRLEIRRRLEDEGRR